MVHDNPEDDAYCHNHWHPSWTFTIEGAAEENRSIEQKRTTSSLMASRTAATSCDAIHIVGVNQS